MAQEAAHTIDRNAELLRHEASYHHFMLGLKWVLIHFASIIAFLTLWFATRAGFLGGLVVGVLIYAAGVYAMRHGLGHSSEHDNPD